jgi:FkbM family methyltransferase
MPEHDMEKCIADICPGCSRGFDYEMKDFAQVRGMLERLDLCGMFIDGGAHVGLWSLRMHEWYLSLKVDCQVLALEPSPRTVGILLRNVGGTRTEVVEKALWKDDKGMPFRYTTNVAGDGLPGTDTNRELHFTVPTVTLDEIYARIGDVDFLKMDIEGAEYEAIQGGEKMFKSGGVKVVMMEFNVNLARHDRTAGELVWLMAKSGYELANVKQRIKVRAIEKGACTRNVIFVSPETLEKIDA